MKTLNVAVFAAFMLGLFAQHVPAYLKAIATNLLQTSYLREEERLSNIQLLAVKIGSTVSLIMLIVWVLWREFVSLFLS